MSTKSGDGDEGGPPRTPGVPRVRAAFTQARSLYPSRGLGFLVLLLGWAGVWVVLELLVISSGGGPWRPVWLLLHLGYFWGTGYWEAAALRYSLESVRGSSPSVWSLFPSHRTALRFLGLKAILIPAAVFGTAFLILPGSWVMARYGFSVFFLIDRDCRVGEALSLSRRWTRRYTGHLMLLSLSGLGLNVLGAAFLGVGILVTIPVTTLTAAAVFRGLDGQDAGRRT